MKIYHGRKTCGGRVGVVIVEGDGPVRFLENPLPRMRDTPFWWGQTDARVLGLSVALAAECLPVSRAIRVARYLAHGLIDNFADRWDLPFRELRLAVADAEFDMSIDHYLDAAELSAPAVQR